MQLTQEQIQYIENRLINEGVKYWDIRIEMLDHIVTDVENRLDYGDQFNEAVQNAMVSLGWKENFNGGGFDKIITLKRNTIGKQINKKLKKEIITSVKITLNIIVYGMFLFVLFSFSELKIYKWTFIALLSVFSLTLALSLINYKKFFKSIYLGTLFSMSFLSLHLLNFLFYLPKMISGQEKNSPIYLTIIIALLVPLFFIQTRLLLKEYKKINNIYKKLFS